jgi:hypothetical protein
MLKAAVREVMTAAPQSVITPPFIFSPFSDFVEGPARTSEGIDPTIYKSDLYSRFI